MIKLSHPEWSNNVGDLGQAALREEQLEALGRIDLLVPVGAGPTIGAAQAREIVDQVQARFVVPHHYRTHRIDFLEPLDDFAARFEHVHRAETPAVDLGDLAGADGPLLVVPAAP